LFCRRLRWHGQAGGRTIYDRNSLTLHERLRLYSTPYWTSHELNDRHALGRARTEQELAR